MNLFPYANFHELNLDWIIEQIKENRKDLLDFVKLNTIKYADPLQWDITKQYEANTVVIDEDSGYAYLSTQPVPSGVALDREEYWIPVFNVFAIYEDIKTGVAYNNRKSDTSLFNLAKGSLVWVNDKMRQVTQNVTKGDRFTDSNSRAINVSDVILELMNNLSALAAKHDADMAKTDKAIGDVNTALDKATADANAAISEVDSKVDATNVALGKLDVKVDTLSKSIGTLNVVAYGAKGDGVTDDYPAFKACYDAAESGATIVVPSGIYLLSKNPYPPADNVSSTSPVGGKLVKWDIASGVYFRGAGAGDITIGRGTYDSPFLTNPWLTISGPTQVFDLNGIPANDKGALVADSRELNPIDTNKTYAGNNWHCLEYRGACTGNSDNTKCNVELLNQVLNITGCKSIATEIDINNYAHPEGFSTGVFLTGGGSGGADMTAIDIQRDEGSTRWVNGVSAHSCVTGFFVDNTNCDTGFQFGDVGRKNRAGIALRQAVNGSDGIVIRRNTDSDPTGNLIVMWDADENTELFAVGARGDIRTAVPIVETRTFTKSGTFQPGEIVFDITPVGGKMPILVSEIHPSGFAAPVWYVSKTDNTVTVFCSGNGTGSISITVLYA